MKKLVIFLGGLIIAVLMNTTAYAGEIGINLYVLTEECPQGAIEYAESNWCKFMTDLPLQDPVFEDIEVELLSLGTPFKMQYDGGTTYTPVYFFPVIYEDEIILLFRVYEDIDGFYKGIMSKSLVHELMEICDDTSAASPVLLSVNNGNIMQTIAGQTTIMCEANDKRAVLEVVSACSLEELTVRNIMDISESYKDVVDSTYNEGYTRSAEVVPTSGFIYLDLAETQGNNNWCAAYVTSSIIRYMTVYDIYAEDIMKYYFPNSIDLKRESLSRANAVAYAEGKGLSPKNSIFTLSSDKVASCISSDSPIYIGCAGNNDTRHAFCLRGYSLDGGYYSLWNPVNDYYEPISITAKTYVTSAGVTYEWDRTIYDF